MAGGKVDGPGAFTNESAPFGVLLSSEGDTSAQLSRTRDSLASGSSRDSTGFAARDSLADDRAFLPVIHHHECHPATLDRSRILEVLLV